MISREIAILEYPFVRWSSEVQAIFVYNKHCIHFTAYKCSTLLPMRGYCAFRVSPTTPSLSLLCSGSQVTGFWRRYAHGGMRACGSTRTEEEYVEWLA